MSAMHQGKNLSRIIGWPRAGRVLCVLFFFYGWAGAAEEWSERGSSLPPMGQTYSNHWEGDNLESRVLPMPPKGTQGEVIGERGSGGLPMPPKGHAHGAMGGVEGWEGRIGAGNDRRRLMAARLQMAVAKQLQDEAL